MVNKIVPPIAELLQLCLKHRESHTNVCKIKQAVVDITEKSFKKCSNSFADLGFKTMEVLIILQLILSLCLQVVVIPVYPTNVYMH